MNRRACQHKSKNAEVLMFRLVPSGVFVYQRELPHLNSLPMILDALFVSLCIQQLHDLFSHLCDLLLQVVGTARPLMDLPKTRVACKRGFPHH